MNSKNMTIEITVTDGERKASGSIDLKSYRQGIKLHNVSLVDEITKALLIEIEKSAPQEKNSEWDDDPWLSDGDMPFKNI